MSLSALAPLRRKIDRLDAAILSLLNQRLRLVGQIGGIKGRYDLPFYDPTREKKIFERLKKQNHGPLTDDALRRIFGELFSAARNLIRPLKIAYLGPRWTFTEQAASRHFGSAPEYVPMSTISEIFAEVESGRVDYGVTPVENSNEGVMTHTLDALLTSNLFIVAEESLRVRLAVLSRSARLREIRDVYSHAHGLAQAAAWLARHIPQAVTHEVASTGAAAKLVSGKKRAAAIASETAAGAYDLKVLASGIESSRQNLTRFLVLGKNISPKSGNDKTSLAFYLKDRVGVLNHVLQCFARHKINLTRIESRPAKGLRGLTGGSTDRKPAGRSPFDYVFFVDFLGHMDDRPVRRALALVRSQCEELRLFGSFPCNSAL